MYESYAGGGQNFWFWFWFGVVLQAIVCGGLSAGLASAKNRDETTWFITGFLFGILGLIAAAGMPKESFQENARSTPSSDEKYGQSHILPGRIECTYCGLLTEVTEDERSAMQFECPFCHKIVQIK